ncbi:glycerol acyltransferase [Serratia sp. S1B]|nr:glycerol acyltransferase [Serratia sp. S1B]
MDLSGKKSLVSAGKPLSPYYRLISSIIRHIYYPGHAVVGDIPLPQNGKPTLFLCSHRNSAFDGYLILSIAPLGQALASIQLLHNPIMRLFFTGIPVVRKKDKERLGISANSFDSPVDAGVAHIKAGGSLILFPEGSSEWGYQPLPYQRGSARIIRSLLSQQIEFNVVPVGLFYVMPDRFASHAEIYVGKPIEIVAQVDNESEREWEKRIHNQITQALDHVSVNCPDEATFHAAEQYAYASFTKGGAYATAFLHYQHQPDARPSNPNTQTACHNTAWRWLGFCMMFIYLPILLAAVFAARFADARNTRSFFKILGGGLASLIWLPLLVCLGVIWPSVIIPSLVSGYIGYKIIQYKGSKPC